MLDKNKKKRKHDIILGLILLSVASILFVIDLTNVSSDTGNKKVVVSVDGKKTAEYPLKKDATYELSGSHLGTNTLVIKSGKAYISEASCPDKQCMKQGKISRAGEMLVCLPNRVVVKIVDSKKDEPVIDGVSG